MSILGQTNSFKSKTVFRDAGLEKVKMLKNCGVGKRAVMNSILNSESLSILPILIYILLLTFKIFLFSKFNATYIILSPTIRSKLKN